MEPVGTKAGQVWLHRGTGSEQGTNVPATHTSYNCPVMHGGDLGIMESPYGLISASKIVSVPVSVLCGCGMHACMNE